MIKKTHVKLPYHLGCSVWSVPEWTGTFYSDDAQPADFLSEYASIFNAVEGNTTFYRMPNPELIKQWGEKTSNTFKFCFKFPKSITHDKKLNNAEDEVLKFVESFEPIRDKLGPFMIQLPASFPPEELFRLEQVFSILPQTMSYSVEVRHPGFFDRGKHERNLISLLKSYNIGRVIFDTRRLHSSKSKDSTIMEAQKKKPKVPVRFEAVSTRPVVRYVGANDVLNNQPYLKEWALVVEDWIREGLHPYVFIHAPNKAEEPKLCAYFHKLLSELMDLPPLTAWPSDTQDEQLGLF
ncbi:MAG: DUF72 domain-containing protein [Balneolaceae bacterium]